jgi:hypothetical protein
MWYYFRCREINPDFFEPEYVMHTETYRHMVAGAASLFGTVIVSAIGLAAFQFIM